MRAKAAAALLFLSFPWKLVAGPLFFDTSQYQPLTLGQLGSFPIPEPSSGALGELPQKKKSAKALLIPAWIRNLNGKKVAVSGFMMPSVNDEDGIDSFALVKSIMNCCYGLQPKVNETVLCDMVEGKKAKFYFNIPVTAYGIFKLDEIKEGGEVVSLFEMSVERVVEMKP